MAQSPRKRTPPPPDPSVVDDWILELQAHAQLPRALMQGTAGLTGVPLAPATMIVKTQPPLAKPELWLPAHPNETDKDWDYRRRTARLRNYFRRTVHVLTGKLFAKPFQVEKPSTVIQNILWDVDRAGTDVQAFGRDLVIDALGGCGLGLFLVDRDKDVPNTAQADQQRRTGPYWVQIKIEDLISLRSAVVDGERVVTHLRFYQTVERAVNEFETARVQQIKVIERATWRVYEELQLPTRGRGTKLVWTLVDGGENKLGFVPLVPVYLNRIGFFQGENPLADLADMNLEHFQIRSEQRRILQVNSFPMLVALNYDGNLDSIQVGPNTITGLKGGDGSKAVDLKFVESQGNHLDAGRNEINDLVDQMRAFGAQFDKPGEIGTVESASGRVIDAHEASSILQLWALSLKDSIELGLLYTDKFLGGDGSLDRVGKVDMSLDFTHVLTDNDLNVLLKVRQMGDLSKETLWRVLRFNSILPEDFDETKEAQLVEEEIQTLIPPTLPAPAGAINTGGKTGQGGPALAS